MLDATFGKAVRVLVKSNPTCLHLMGVPEIEVLSVLAYVSIVEDPARFGPSRSVGAHLRLKHAPYVAATEAYAGSHYRDGGSASWVTRGGRSRWAARKRKKGLDFRNI